MDIKDDAQRQASEIVKEYLDSETRIRKIKETHEAEEEAIRRKERKELDKIDHKMRDLRDEENNTRNKFSNQLENARKKRETAILPFADKIAKTACIMSLLEIAESFEPVKDINDGDVKQCEHYTNRFLEWQNYIHHDDFLKIRILIVENNKPKNKYSVMAYGRCAFTKENLIKLPYYYGGPSLNDYNNSFSIKIESGSYPSIDEAKKRSENAKKIFESTIRDVELLEQEYRIVTQKYKLSDFKKIVEKR